MSAKSDNNRVEQLERAAGITGDGERKCSCLNFTRVYYADSGEPKPSGICPECGGALMIINVKYEDEMSRPRD